MLELIMEPSYTIEGWLMKRGGVSDKIFTSSRWHRRYFALHGDQLLYFLNKEAAVRPSSARGVIPLDGAGLYSAIHSKYGSRYFEIRVPTSQKKFPLAAESDADFERWILAVLEVIDTSNSPPKANLTDEKPRDTTKTNAEDNIDIMEASGLPIEAAHYADALSPLSHGNASGHLYEQTMREPAWSPLSTTTNMQQAASLFGDTAEVATDTLGAVPESRASSPATADYECELLRMEIEDESSSKWRKAVNTHIKSESNTNNEGEVTFSRANSVQSTPERQPLAAEEGSDSKPVTVQPLDASIHHTPAASVAPHSDYDALSASGKVVHDAGVTIDYRRLAAALREELESQSNNDISVILQQSTTPTKQVLSSPVTTRMFSPTASGTRGYEDIAALRNRLFDALKRVDETEAHIAGMAQALRKERQVVLNALAETDVVPLVEAGIAVSQVLPHMDPYVGEESLPSSRSATATHTEDINHTYAGDRDRLYTSDRDQPYTSNTTIVPLRGSYTREALLSIPSPRSLLHGPQLSKHIIPSSSSSSSSSRPQQIKAAPMRAPADAEHSVGEDSPPRVHQFNPAEKAHKATLSSAELLDKCMGIVQQEYAAQDFAPCIAAYSDLLADLFSRCEDEVSGVGAASFKMLLSECGLLTWAAHPDREHTGIVICEDDVESIFARLLGALSAKLTYAQFIAALLMISVLVVERAPSSVLRHLRPGIQAGTVSCLRAIIEGYLRPYHNLLAQVEVVNNVATQDHIVQSNKASATAGFGPAVRHGAPVVGSAVMSRAPPKAVPAKPRSGAGRSILASLFDMAKGAASVLPESHLIALCPLEQKAMAISGLREIIQRDQRALKSIFLHYAVNSRKLNALSSGSVASRSRSASISSAESSVGSVCSAVSRASRAIPEEKVLTLVELSKFGRDFNLWPALMSQAELMRLGCDVIGDIATLPAVDGVQLNYPAFEELLARVAVACFMLRGGSPSMSDAAAVNLLLYLDGGEGRQAMMRGSRTAAGAQLRFLARFNPASS